MERKLLTNIISCRYVRKNGKYVAELGVYEEAKQIVWLTYKQMLNLMDCFDQTTNGFSNKHVSVYGHWNDNGYYAYTSVLHHKQPRRFKEPAQRDVSDLWEDD